MTIVGSVCASCVALLCVALLFFLVTTATPVSGSCAVLQPTPVVEGVIMFGCVRVRVRVRVSFSSLCRRCWARRSADNARAWCAFS